MISVSHLEEGKKKKLDVSPMMPWNLMCLFHILKPYMKVWIAMSVKDLLIKILQFSFHLTVSID